MRSLLLVVAVLLVGILSCYGPETTEETPSEPVADAAAEPTPDEQVAQLEAMCAGAQEAMAGRQAAKSLYERLGGREQIHAVVEDVVRRHEVNDQISHLLEGVDTVHLVNQVTDFLVVGSGGEGEYEGLDMATAHAHLELTNADFLAAGADVGAAMTAAGVGADEQPGGAVRFRRAAG